MEVKQESTQQGANHHPESAAHLDQPHYQPEIGGRKQVPRLSSDDQPANAIAEAGQADKQENWPHALPVAQD